MYKLPCLVSPERDDFVDTDDCTETMEDVSAMLLSVIKPPPSPSVWTVILDWQKGRKIIFTYIFCTFSLLKQENSKFWCHLQLCFHYPGTPFHYWFLQGEAH